MTKSASIFNDKLETLRLGVFLRKIISFSDNPLQEKNLNLKWILLTSRQVFYSVYKAFLKLQSKIITIETIEECLYHQCFGSIFLSFSSP